MSKEAGALSAKAKAMFGERLKSNHYQQLLQKKNVAEIAGYLKRETYFASCLQDINEKAIHRGQLESLLRMDLFNRLAKLIRYANSDTKGYINFIVMQNEINQILMCIRSFITGDRLLMIAKMPTYMNDYLSFDLSALSTVDNFDGLLEVLKSTVYYAPVERFKTNDMDELDFVGLEHELKETYYKQFIKTVNESSSGQSKKALEDLYMTNIEMSNIEIIYRLKKYFNESPTRIRRLINDGNYKINRSELNHIIDDCSADQMIEELNHTAYHNYIGSHKFMYIEHFTKTISYNLNYHYLEFNDDANVVLLAYMTLSDIEIQNVVDIIEGARYGIAQERIKQLLIY